MRDKDGEMKKKIIFLFLITGLTIFLKNIYAHIDRNLEEDNKEKLALILEKSAEYCERLAKATLYFVCREKIQESINYYKDVAYSDFYREGNKTVRKSRKVNTYTYDYQLVKKGDSIKENRILLEENGKKKYEKNALLKTKRFFTERPFGSPIGLLSKYWQNFYNYKIIKEEDLEGKETIVIEAKPKSPMKEKPNYGKIWVDKEDFSILKIEFLQESLAKFEELRKMARKYLLKPRLTDTHYFGIEKNGIRFPSKVHFAEAYLTKDQRRLVFSETTFIYDDYKFFTVEVEIVY